MNIEEERKRCKGAESVELPIDKWKKILDKLEILELLHKYSYTFQNETIYIAVDCMDLYDKEKVKEWLENNGKPN